MSNHVLSFWPLTSSARAVAVSGEIVVDGDALGLHGDDADADDVAEPAPEPAEAAPKPADKA